MAARRRDDRGAVTASVAVLPAVLVLFFSVVQLSLWFYGRSVATTAARHGLDAARVQSGSESDGITTAHDFLDQAAGVINPTVTADRTETDVEVTVVGEPIAVLPFLTPSFTVTIEGPVERFVE